MNKLIFDAEIKIAVLGNFSGRNAGDAAILGNLLDDISQVCPNAEFLVPTLNTIFLREHFGQYNLRPLSLMPWHGAIKIFGLPTLRAMLQSDIILITDNILFDRQLFNPLFNYLSTVALLAPLCRRLKIPIVLYNASLGPIETRLGKQALNRALVNSPLLILRDQQSVDLLEKLQVRCQTVHLGADCALNTVPSPHRIDEICHQEQLFQNSTGTLGININTYIDAWAKQNKRFGRRSFLKVMSETLDRIITELDVDILCFITQTMDARITYQTLKQMKWQDRVRSVSNAKYTYQEIAGLMQQVDLLVGMRTHSLILSAAVGTPMLAINAYPKTAGFMKTIGQESWVININDLSADSLTKLIHQAWRERQQTKASLAAHLQREQAKARNSAALVTNLLAKLLPHPQPIPTVVSSLPELNQR